MTDVKKVMDELSPYFNEDTCDESVSVFALACAIKNIRETTPFRPNAERIFACAEKRKAGEKFDMKALVIALLESIGALNSFPDRSPVALHEAGHAVVMLTLAPDNLLFTTVYGYTANIDEGGINGAIAGLGGIVATKSSLGGLYDEMQVRELLKTIPENVRPTFEECKRRAEWICEENRELIEAVAKGLERKEVLTASEIRKIKVCLG